MDGLDGAMVARGWDRRTLAPTGTGEPPWAPEQERHHWLSRGGDALACYCMDGTDGADRTDRKDGTDGLDGALVRQGWDGRTLAGARTRAASWAPEQERHRWLLRGGGLCEVAARTNCVCAAKTRIKCVGETK